VRGVETAGGRVAAAMTEKGRVFCDNVVLAGGAWLHLFAAISAAICRSSRSWARWCAPRNWGSDPNARHRGAALATASASTALQHLADRW
jgi:hypothetical protein